jgi:tetratricopeptide (TPR) repeat protein
VRFCFGGGWYGGSACYHPYRRWGNWCDYGFFYPRRVCYCYVPYGFYWGYDPVYITRTVYVREDYPIREYGTEELPVEPPAEGEVVEPQPAAGSPAAERFLREASEAFREADYATAADKFRLAAISASDQAGPLFAFGQALLALGRDDYAARVMRAAFRLDPKLPRETGDIAGVYKDAAEFDRVLRSLEERAAASPAGSDARFLLAVQRYFTGDPRARTDFARLGRDLPEDEAVALFRMAVEERFKAEEELPPLR